jgi:hypothetical protein
LSQKLKSKSVLLPEAKVAPILKEKIPAALVLGIV